MASHQIDPGSFAVPHRHSILIARMTVADSPGWTTRDSFQGTNSQWQTCRQERSPGRVSGTQGRLDFPRPPQSCRRKIDISGGSR